MIGTGRSISYGAAKITYDAGKTIHGEKVASEFIRHNVYGDTPLEVIEEMQDVIENHKPNLQNGYFDFVVTLSEEDEKKFKSDAEARYMLEQFMRKLMTEKLALTAEQYETLQWIAYQHEHTDNNQHLKHWHILANHLLPDGTYISDSNIGRKTVDVANSLSRLYNLSDAQEISKRNKAEIRAVALEVLRQMPVYSYQAFKAAMAEQGIMIRDALNSKGELQGYYFTARSGTEYKASAIDRDFTLKRIAATHESLRWKVKMDQDLKEMNDRFEKYQARQQEARNAARQNYEASHTKSFKPSLSGPTIHAFTPHFLNRETAYSQSSSGETNNRRRGKRWEDMSDDEKELASKGMSY